MPDFAIRFLVCNIFIAGMIGFILIIKRLFNKYLTSRMRYQLWFVMLILLAVPFLPIRPLGFTQLIAWLHGLYNSVAQSNAAAKQTTSSLNTSTSSDWMNDFGISVSRDTPSGIEIFILAVWLTGMLAMILLMVKSAMRLWHLKHSAMPLQNQQVQILYQHCNEEMHLKKHLPIYSTAFLKSPVMVGLLRPSIYLPIHLISDYNADDMRFMLLHELQHYIHKDALINYLMNLAGIFYWFNPFVWYALKEMRIDREVACDTSVLQLLDEKEYEDYGNTLINFAEKLSVTSFPFATGIGGSISQIKQRIISIANYETLSFRNKVKGRAAFLMASLLLIGLAPAFSTYAISDDYYQWKTKNKNIFNADLSAYFKDYDGSFVLYNSGQDTWAIYNQKDAQKRVSPDSTYKIYDALWGLEAGLITPENSSMDWNKSNYSFDAWNADQDLNSAMKNSVNWYFQTLDSQIGIDRLRHNLQQIQYGNQDISGDLSSYWLESSLKISPVEQVELLRQLYHNDFNFKPANVQAVKDALHLQSTSESVIYGKTGTGRISDQDVNGWFIGYIERADNTFFFCINIQADSKAAGSEAAKIAMSILSDQDILR